MNKPGVVQMLLFAARRPPAGEFHRLGIQRDHLGQRDGHHLLQLHHGQGGQQGPAQSGQHGESGHRVAPEYQHIQVQNIVNATKMPLIIIVNCISFRQLATVI